MLVVIINLLLQNELEFNQCAVAVFSLIIGCCYLKYDTPKPPTLAVLIHHSPLQHHKGMHFLLQAIKNHHRPILYSVYVRKPSARTIITKTSSPTKSNIQNFQPFKYAIYSQKYDLR